MGTQRHGVMTRPSCGLPGLDLGSIQFQAHGVSEPKTAIQVSPVGVPWACLVIVGSTGPQSVGRKLEPRWALEFSRAEHPVVSGVRYTPASQDQVRDGLLGYVSFLLDGRVRLDGITVRRTAAGEVRLSFPAKRTRSGDRPYIRPIDDATREAIERQVFAALQPEAPR